MPRPQAARAPHWGRGDAPPQPRGAAPRPIAVLRRDPGRTTQAGKEERMKVYLAAPWSERLHMQAVAWMLTRVGFEVTSRWLSSHVEAPEGASVEDYEQEWAMNDVLAIEAADVLCVTTIAPANGGGRDGGEGAARGEARHRGGASPQRVLPPAGGGAGADVGAGHRAAVRDAGRRDRGARPR